MIREVNQACKKMNDFLGISINLPEPRKSTLQATAILNFVVGTGLVATGIALSSKWWTALGGIAIASSIIQKHEAKIAK